MPARTLGRGALRRRPTGTGGLSSGLGEPTAGDGPARGLGCGWVAGSGRDGSKTRKPWFLISFLGFLMFRYAERALFAVFV